MTDVFAYQEVAYAASSGAAVGEYVYQITPSTVGRTEVGAVRVQKVVAYTVGVAPAFQTYDYQQTVYAVVAAEMGLEVPQVFPYLLHGELPATRRLRAWTFSMDGHDFYVLVLGKDGTLIYDVTTGQFFTWESSGYLIWRAAMGLNWENEIVGGDFMDGNVYNIDPGNKRDFGTETIISYVTGFIGHRGRDPLPCYGVTLITSQGAPSDEQSGVELRISDDLEQNFWSAGKLVMPVIGAADYDLSWYSLGQIQQPGRIFQLIDYGYADRIDALEFLEGPKGG